ncbi:MAG: type III pantothenate kinase [Bacteroidales bacterium]|nr:type III pantothenate kinase [Bacteroidales bacterium]
MAVLLVEIGNTSVMACWADGMTLGKTFRYQGEKRLDFILSLAGKESPEVTVVSSVTSLSTYDKEKITETYGNLVVLDPSTQGALSGYGVPDSLPFDRAASFLACRYLFKDKKCTVFDFGTTLTVDLIGEDGSYKGGAISLGLRTRFKSLNRYSRTLPLVNIPSGEVLPGKNIRTSIEAGVISGIMFEIKGWMEINEGGLAVFTGGDAIYFAKRMKNSIFVVCNLVLMGLAIIAGDYVKKNDR